LNKSVQFHKLKERYDIISAKSNLLGNKKSSKIKGQIIHICQGSYLPKTEAGRVLMETGLDPKGGIQTPLPALSGVDCQQCGGGDSPL